MSKMGQELEDRLDVNKYELYEACKQGLAELYYLREMDNDPAYATTTVTILEEAIAKVEGK